MIAIAMIAGKQYKVAEGETVVVDLLDAKVDDVVKFPVLMTIDGEKVVAGSPEVKNVFVQAKVLESFKDKKILVYKYKAKKNERKKQGHRQPKTKIIIESIG